MSEKNLTKKQWGEGPWQHEPDELEWVDAATGYKCRIARGPVGHLCGYVCLPETHAAYGLHYDGILEAEANERSAHFRAEMERVKSDFNKWEPGPTYEPVPGIGEAIRKIEVHGGLTWAGERNGAWEFGFDCAHAGDYCPEMEAMLHRIYITNDESIKWQQRQERMAALGPQWQDTYRTIDYVRQEVTELARQLKALEVAVDVASYTSHRSE